MEAVSLLTQLRHGVCSCRYSSQSAELRRPFGGKTGELEKGIILNFISIIGSSLLWIPSNCNFDTVSTCHMHVTCGC